MNMTAAPEITATDTCTNRFGLWGRGFSSGIPRIVDRKPGFHKWARGAPASAVLVLDALAAARPLAGDVVERAEHAAGAALDAVLVVDDDLIVGRLPLVDLRGAHGGAGLVLARGHAGRVRA